MTALRQYVRVVKPSEKWVRAGYQLLDDDDAVYCSFSETNFVYLWEGYVDRNVPFPKYPSQRYPSQRYTYQFPGTGSIRDVETGR